MLHAEGQTAMCNTLHIQWSMQIGFMSIGAPCVLSSGRVDNCLKGGPYLPNIREWYSEGGLAIFCEHQRAALHRCMAPVTPSYRQLLLLQHTDCSGWAWVLGLVGAAHQGVVAPAHA